MTPRTPPFGFDTSPSYRGIRWIWACPIVWPAASLILIPILYPDGENFFSSNSLLWLIKSQQADCISESNSKYDEKWSLGIISKWPLLTGNLSKIANADSFSINTSLADSSIQKGQLMFLSGVLIIRIRYLKLL